ncbi:multiple coagulation factor deficiency protein 2 homolog isoform X5 [Aedes albopictus]|uniref:EF-hand domain-containing protein n=1 Tax=Aedes albopictus TaxID=7160 RepID=A0ABM1Y6Q3_AEDAL|nr:multiple coagulation factor deficiency protein 2 homolog isoform X5 [Aedes albopictus]
MKQIALLTLTTLLLATVALGQRVAPGVNPGHYQQQPQQQYQPPPPQYNQHPPQQAPPQQHYQQQQPQYQQQQVPVQPQYQQQQQVPVQQQHHQQPPQHGAPQHHGQPQQVLNANNIQQEKAHIAEHMDVPIDTSKMSEQELQFHYFKMHDSDNNNKLDGCELIKSLIHWHENDKSDKHHPMEIYTDEQLTAVVEAVLTNMDHNQDGYVDWGEYRTSEAERQP